MLNEKPFTSQDIINVRDAVSRAITEIETAANRLAALNLMTNVETDLFEHRRDLLAISLCLSQAVRAKRRAEQEVAA